MDDDKAVWYYATSEEISFGTQTNKIASMSRLHIDFGGEHILDIFI
jgi:hypothetical protein